MTTNSQLSTTEFKKKNKLSKQLEQEQNHRNGDHMEGYQQGSGRGSEGEKVQRISSINGRQQIDRGRVGIGNVEAKELICMTHGLELKWENASGRGGAGWSGIKGGKWDNCNSIINKIYCKKMKYFT